MRMMGLKSIVLAVGLAMAGVGHAAPQVPASSPAAATASTTPATAPAAEKPAAAAPTDPMLAMDGAPAMKPTQGIGMPVAGEYGLEPQVTKNGERALLFHNNILVPVITVISVFVLVLLLWVMFRYRASANPVPSKTSHNTLIEVIWTGVPVIILALIAAPSIGLLSAQFKPAPDNAVTLKAIGNQWYWTYQYPDNGGFEITSNLLKEKKGTNHLPGLEEAAAGERARTDDDGPALLATDNRVVLPVGVPIRLLTTSNDVIHSWSIPAFWVKLDAVPGRVNETSFTIEKPGVYFGVCSELCGARHGYMPITVEAVTPAVFAAWVKAKGGTMPGGKPAAAAAAPAPAAANASDVAGNATAASDNLSAPAAAGASNAGQ
jgi:cytochrome c oxidase subunit 2